MRWENSTTDQGTERKLSDKDLHLIIDLKKSKVNHRETSMVRLLLKMSYHLHHLIMKGKTCQVVIQDPEDLGVEDISIAMEENMIIMNLKANMITMESMIEKAITTEERILKDMRVETIVAITERMISTELTIVLSTCYTQSNSLTWASGLPSLSQLTWV